MFDVDLPGGESYRESANYQPGETAVISDLPWGRLGLTICYDVRFPALYRALAEAGARSHRALRFHPPDRRSALAHAAARPRHRERLLRVRRRPRPALHENKRETYGHSLIVAPGASILAEGGVEPGIVMAEIDPGKVETARKTVPSLQHGRRFERGADGKACEHLHVVRGSA
jgi:predicted amidohydrolase